MPRPALGPQPPTIFSLKLNFYSHLCMAQEFNLTEQYQFLPKYLPIIASDAPNRLLWGGIRSGKTFQALMVGLFSYALRFEKCDILVLRRNYSQLEAGGMKDFTTIIPRDSYNNPPSSNNQRVTLKNGSSVVFGHMATGKDKDIMQYLGSAYPFILVDECGEFSPEAWELLSSRNTINPGCIPDAKASCGGCGRPEECGYACMPSPSIWGCTNPAGPHWGFYKSVFVDKVPWNPPEGTRKDVKGAYWVKEYDTWRCVYDPDRYAECHTTPLDNPPMLLRDPQLVARLKSMPKHMQDKYLWGLAGKVEGQFFDCFSEAAHVINLRADPDQIIWGEYQNCWGGWDWGQGHYNTVYFFTRVLHETLSGHKSKILCFREVVERNKTDVEMADIVRKAARHPLTGAPLHIRSIFFSHEKFNRQLEAQSPAVQFSKLLQARSLPALTPASRDRVSSAAYMYNTIKKGELIITDNCQEIIRAIPSLLVASNLNDVYKPDGVNKFDDCYDGFRYGLYGMATDNPQPRALKELERINSITDPFCKSLAIYKQIKDKARKQSPGYSNKEAPWMDKI